MNKNNPFFSFSRVHSVRMPFYNAKLIIQRIFLTFLFAACNIIVRNNKKFEKWIVVKTADPKKIGIGFFLLGGSFVVVFAPVVAIVVFVVVAVVPVAFCCCCCC